MSPSEVRQILGPLPHESVYRDCRNRAREELMTLQLQQASHELRLRAIRERIAMLKRVAGGLIELLESSNPSAIVNQNHLEKTGVSE